MRTRFYFIIVTLMLMGLVLSACAADTASAQSAPNAQVRTLVVAGQGKSYLTPDIATINIGVHTEGTEVAEAVSRNTAQATKVADALKAAGIDPKDVQTSNFNIYPQQQFGPNGETVSSKYVVDNTVYVTVRDLNQLKGKTRAGMGACGGKTCPPLIQRLFREEGLRVVEYRVFPSERAAHITPSDLPFGLPAVVKPGGEGSSVGVHIVREPAQLAAACADAAAYKGGVIVERYVKGTEVDVAVLDGKSLGAIEIVPTREFYDYVAKYTPGMTNYYYPARLPAEEIRAVSEAAEKAYAALGCSGIVRIDFIVARGTPYILEVNTLPGMTATSLVPKIAAGNGISFPDLCERLLEGAALKG